MAYKLKKEILLKAKRKDVWETYRDHLTNLVSTMPSVDKIEMLNREEFDDGIRIKNLWQLAVNFPKPINKIIPASLISYHDLAFWNHNSWICEFTETPQQENGLYKCVGNNTFEDIGDKTRLVISFVLTIDAKKIPGIPSFLKKGMVAKIEKIISNEVAKNLAFTASKVEQFINENTNKS